MTISPTMGREDIKALVTTDWVASHQDSPGVRFLESNEDPLVYPSGHIPGAFELDWGRDLNDPLVRDYIDDVEFESLCSRLAITRDTLVVFYGDKSNWWACYAFWVFQLFGHTNAAVMDGGRLKWVNEGRPLETANPKVEPTEYQAPRRDDKTDRAFREDVLLHLADKNPMIDVRSPEEFTGERMQMADYPNESALRGGHVPGAKNIPWARATKAEDGTFKSQEELIELYKGQNGIQSGDDIITYCRIGERSSHTWFVLKHILGWSNVRNYDGSWTEWGNAVGLPVEK